jgi:glycosyltransferase involved in cell wall biosynthesis
VRTVLLSHNLEGGAGGAAYRLNAGLRRIGVDSTALVQFDDRKEAGIETVPRTRLGWRLAFRRGRLDRLPVRLYRRRQRPHSLWPLWVPHPSVNRRLEELRPDVVNLHWLLDGFVNLEALPQIRAPLVWTLHDMWPFTGGCDYSLGCDRYARSCGACPVVGSRREHDLSRLIWMRKARAWRAMEPVIVAPGRWLARCARESSLFGELRVEVIPYGVDTAIFKPLPRDPLRRLLNLPENRFVVLFAAWDDTPRKGMQHLHRALRSLGAAGWGERLVAVTVGQAPLGGGADLGVPVRWLGRVHDEVSMAAIYASADVLVVPSVWENLPQTAVEALACGTPVVAFDGQTGLPDLVEHEWNGYLARPFDGEDLASGIAWVLEDAARRAVLAANARAKAEREYDLEGAARRYEHLFDEVLAGGNHAGG